MDIKNWFKNLIATNYFFTKVTNPSEISDPIVKAIENKEIPQVNPDDISSPIVNALDDVVTAIESKEGVEEVTVKNIEGARTDLTDVITLLTNILNKEEKEIKFPEQKETVIDLKPIVKGLGELKKKIPVIKPVKIPDYTSAFQSIVSAIEQDKTGNLAKTKDIETLAILLQEIRDKEQKEYEFEFKDGRLKVEVDRAGGSFSDPGVKNIANEYINPATEENQDITASYSISDLDESGSTKYYGFLNKEGKWYIMAYTGATARYYRGDSGYDFSLRATYTYDTFNNIF